MDVTVEGENVVRNLDLTTHNHASPLAGTPRWPYADSMTKAQLALCAKDRKNENDACKKLMVAQKGDPKKVDRKASEDKMCADTDDARKCQKARQCMLVPYEPDKKKK